MDIFTTKPIKEIDNISFRGIIKNKEISVTRHGLDHLSDKQRNIFKKEDLIYMLTNETPRKIYLQKNGRYAIYYRKSEGYRKLVIELKNNKVIIVTFIDLTELPKYNL